VELQEEWINRETNARQSRFEIPAGGLVFLIKSESK
jgi:hypothetical protein